jgi:hypothetical protein
MRQLFNLQVDCSINTSVVQFSKQVSFIFYKLTVSLKVCFVFYMMIVRFIIQLLVYKSAVQSVSQLCNLCTAKCSVCMPFSWSIYYLAGHFTIQLVILQYM